MLRKIIRLSNINVALISLFMINASISQTVDDLISQLDVDPNQQQEIQRMIQGSDASAGQRLVDVPQATSVQSLQRNTESFEVNGIKKYGYDLFSGTSQPFTMNATVPSNYLIGVGDEIEILFLGSENRIAKLMVNREGTVFVPDIGPITVAGLTFREAKELLQTRIRNQKIGVEASITMGKLQPIQIFITGDAVNPGSFLVSSLSTLTNALFVSGGIKDIGSLRKIDLKRNGEIVARFDLYDFLMKGDNSADVRLEPGDVIYIPPVGETITIRGEIVREAIYELLGGESLDEIISYAGGLLPSTNKKLVQLKRFSGSKLELIDIDLSKDNPNTFYVTNGDDFKFSRIYEQVENYVYLEGFLKETGMIQWKDSMTVSDVISVDQSLLSGTDLNYAVIVSENFPDGQLSMNGFNLGKAIEQSKSEHDPILRPRDTVLIFSLIDSGEEEKCSFASKKINNLCNRINSLELSSEGDENEDIDGIMSNRNLILSPYIFILRNQSNEFGKRKLSTITGAVRYPGTYPHDESKTAAYLIDAAGGLSSKAYKSEAEIITKSINRFGEVKFSQKSFNLERSLNESMPLESQLNIKAIREDESYVNISGEVLFPGRYSLINNETLSDLVKRAGGFTEDAFINGAFFSREKLRQIEEERLDEARVLLEQEVLLSSMNELGQVQNEQLVSQLNRAASSIQATGRLVIDLEKIMNGTNKDIILEDLDNLIVPKKSSEVTVIGEVNTQTSHVFSDTISKDEYIELSGGFTAFADQNGSYVISSNGSIKSVSEQGFFRGQINQIEPGDTIVVPADIKSTDRIRTATELTQIIYQMSVAAAAVSSF